MSGRRINITGSISRETISDIVNPCVPAMYNHYGVMDEQYLVSGEFHLGPPTQILQWTLSRRRTLAVEPLPGSGEEKEKILQWSRGEESAVYFPTRSRCASCTTMSEEGRPGRSGRPGARALRSDESRRLFESVGHDLCRRDLCRRRHLRHRSDLCHSDLRHRDIWRRDLCTISAAVICAIEV